LRAGDAEAAIGICEQGLKAFPGDANIMVIAARACLALKRFDESAKYAEEAIRLYPEFAAAHDVHGDLLSVTGQVDLAVSAYEKTLRLDPARPATLEKIDRARRMAKKNASELPLSGLTARVKRQQMAFAAEIREVEKLLRDEKQQEAEKILRNVLKKDPDHVEAARQLARVAVFHERYREAEVFLRRAVTLAPDFVRAWVDLANVQRELDQFEDALVSAEKVLELSPRTAESFMLYASIIGTLDQHDKAIEYYEKALALDPQKAGAMCSIAHHLKTVGRQDEAIAQYRACIATKPDHSEAFWSLANLKTFRFTDAEVDAMERLLDQESLTDLARLQIHNALGLEYEGRRKFDQAFANFEQCNLIRRRAEKYDPVDTESTHDRVIELFDSEFLAQAAAPTVQPTPIFIVGLPRSGSTLIEQILASHSRVDGTHELGDLAKSVRTQPRRSRKNERFPETLARLKVAGWTGIAREYMSRTERYRAGAPFFIDKNPNNFVFAGVLKLAMPNAKIINARRHPLDSCLGAFKQLFASGQPFTYDMTELAEYYLQYQRLMDHWHEVLPGFVLDVQYEDVVADLEGQVTRILGFCGLPYEDSCLKFHETERAVKTASSEQVRKPIYSSSVNLWRNYEAHLDPLVHMLEPLLNALPEADRPAVLLQEQQKAL
jgi:tetratricopeptide (TPR) repeat protein